MSKLKKKNKKTQMEKDWDSMLPFYLQWYWTTDWENKKSKAWYHGHRIDWMKLVNVKQKL